MPCHWAGTHLKGTRHMVPIIIPVSMRASMHMLLVKQQSCGQNKYVAQHCGSMCCMLSVML